MTTPTPEQFLAQPADPEDEELEPLESIADSLRRLVDHVEAHTEEEKASDALRERQDDLQAEYDTLHQLVDEVEAIVKPSTSKLANSVREAIGRWKSPKFEPEQPVDYAEGQAQPDDDADVEEWRAYARTKQGVAQGTVIDQMNRSQIRTMLGIEQPVASSDG